jgi:hypothetical protein
MHIMKLLISCNVYILLLASLSLAQPPNSEMQKQSTLKFTYLRVNDYRTTTYWAGYLDWGIASSKGLKYLVELPYAHYGYSDSYYYPYQTYSNDMLGNIYVGIEGGKAKSGTFYEAGIRFPTASDKKQVPISSIISDIARLEAFYQNAAVIKGALGYRGESGSGIMTLVKIGPAFWINSDKNDGEDGSELFVYYSCHFWYYGAVSDYGIGLTGIGDLSEDQILYQNKFVNRFEFGMGFKTGNFRPGFDLFLPLSNDLEANSYVLNLNITLSY